MRKGGTKKSAPGVKMSGPVKTTMKPVFGSRTGKRGGR
jgi:hypothetical protein